jgi:hypothetical protein
MGTDIQYYIQVNKHAQQFYLNAEKFTLLWSYLKSNLYESWESIADQFEELELESPRTKNPDRVTPQTLHDIMYSADRDDIDFQFVGMENNHFIIEIELISSKRYFDTPVIPKRWVNVHIGREIFWRDYSQFAVMAGVKNKVKNLHDSIWPVLFECRGLPTDMGTSFTRAMKEEYVDSHDASFLSLDELEQIHQQKIIKERGSPIETAVIALNGYAQCDDRKKEDIRVVFWFGS